MLRFRSFVLCCCFALLHQWCCSQDFQTLNKDSLLNLLKGSKDDTDKVLLLIKVGNDFERNQPDSAMVFYKKAEALSQKIHWDIGILKYIANYTAVLNMKGKFNESLELNKKAIDLAQRINNDNYLAMSYGNTAAVYAVMHMHQLSIEYYLRCIELLEKLQNESRLTVAYANLASVYSDIDENEKAIWYGFRAISMSRKTHDDYNLEGSLNNTANAFAVLKRYDTALVLYQQAKALSAKLNDKYVLAESQIGMAEVYHEKKLFLQMKENATLALEASRSIDYKPGIAKSIYILAEFYFEEKNYELARQFALDAIHKSLQNQIIETTENAYSLLSDIYLALGDLPAFHLYRNEKDSLQSLMVSNQIIQNTQELEAEYSLSKKEATITGLTRLQELQKLSIQQGKKLNLILAGLLMAILLSGFLFYRNYTNKKKLLTARNAMDQQRISELEKETQFVAMKAVLEGQEQERERLAKELHDGLGSVLSGVKFNFVGLEHQFADQLSKNKYESCLSSLNDSIGELRRIAHNLMPEAIMKFGLIAALDDFCQGIAQHSSLQLTFQSYQVKEETIPLEVSAVIFRMTQELIQNIFKHASAEHALVQLMGADDSLIITVEDDGVGFSPDILENKKGIGFTNIKNRVIYLHGTLDVISAPGNGTSVTITLPNIFA